VNFTGYNIVSGLIAKNNQGAAETVTMTVERVFMDWSIA
jgi:hypothetical protein